MRGPALKSVIDVGNRLDRLGTSRKLMLEVVDAVVAARAECTQNDPSGARGWRGWQMGTRRNRELHGQVDGWDKDDTDQIASIVNRRLGVKIIVCNTDEGTCIEGLTPQNRSKKGAATERVIDRNQYSFFDKMDVPHPDSIVVPLRKAEPSVALVSYYLCVYHEGDDIRAELSCAVESAGGYFEDFVERIFIVGGEAGSDDGVRRKKPSDDDGSDFEIPVKRKK